MGKARHDSKTLIGLKRLIEVVRDSGTLSVVLAGHPKLKNDLRRPSIEEIGSRATIFELEGLGREKSKYLKWLRKKLIHIGSPEAGPRVAAIISIVESCSRLNIPIRDYLGSVLPGLANRPISQIAQFTPAAWANRNALAMPPTSAAV